MNFWFLFSSPKKYNKKKLLDFIVAREIMDGEKVWAIKMMKPWIAKDGRVLTEGS